MLGPVWVRVVSGNLTSGALSSYDPGHGQRIFQGLQGDVILIQQFNSGDGSDASIRNFVDTTFGLEFSFFRGAGTLPNGVISRFPILMSGEQMDPSVNSRGFSWALLDLPNNPHDLWVISVHFHTSVTQRVLEADALVAFIQFAIPAGDHIIIGGTLNTDNTAEVALSRLSAVVQSGGPFPVDQYGNSNTSAPRSRPLDYVLASPQLDQMGAATVLGPFNFPNGLVFDTRIFSQVELDANAPPALVNDSGATGMLHMAVVRSFAVTQ